MELLILGQKWKAYLHEEEKYIRNHGDDTEAYTWPKEKEIHFNEEEFCLRVVTHELVHAFYSETCTTAACLDAAQVEEVLAEMFGYHGDKILRLARKLYKALKDNQ